MKNYLLVLSLIIVPLLFANGQTIQNIQARAEKNKVIINYDLVSDIEGQKFTVELRSSIDNYAAPLKEVTGDVGPDQTPGLGKTITWNGLKEQGNFSGSVTFEVVATLTFSPLTIIAPTAGAKGKIGKPLDVKWQGGSKDRALKMAILQGDNTIDEIPNVGNSGSYSWTVPKTTPKGENYKIKLFDPTKPNDAVMSAEFQLKKTSILVYVIPGAVAAGVAAYFIFKGGGGDCTDVCNPACANYNPSDPSCQTPTDEFATPPPPPGGGN